MADDYFYEHQDFLAAQALPSPSDTPYQTPAISRRSSRYEPFSPGPPSSPLPGHSDGHFSDDTANDEHISILDPRRFTPTLHASLVSEILSLRRELDSKDRFIEDLETTLHTVKVDNDTLNEKLSQTTKDGRSMKKQLQQLENGTLSALEELVKERDEAKDTNAELKEKLESLSKKIRSQEDDSNRTHSSWEKDKEAWDKEKRLLERRVHITESRLKLIIDELAANNAAAHDDTVTSEGEESVRDTIGNESDTTSIRTMSRRGSIRSVRHARNTSSSSHRSFGRSYRFSMLSGTGSEAPGKFNGGMSLADELKFDEEDEELDELEVDSDDFPENEMRARRALSSRQSSIYPDEKAKRILGLTNQNKGPVADVNEDETTSLSGDTTALRDTLTSPVPVSREYVDTGVQFSPPPSPKLRPDTATAAKTPEQNGPLAEVEANQRRKRVTIFSPSLYFKQHTMSPVKSSATTMVSTSSQTMEQPLSPPATPKVIPPSSPQTPTSPVKVSVAYASTQTEPVQEIRAAPPIPASPTRAPPPVPISVPSIAIHPPHSAPQSPKDAILPPGTKNVACQTEVASSYSVRSISIQTEEIRIDRRPVKLPPHLLPSAISSKPGTPEPNESRQGKTISSTPSPLQPPIILLTQEMSSGGPSVSDIRDQYPGNNDNGPLARDSSDILRRPFRTSSLFAGFSGGSSDEEDVLEADASDDDFRSPPYPKPMASSRPSKHGRPLKAPPTPVPEEKEVSSSPLSGNEVPGTAKIFNSGRNSFERASKVTKPPRISTTTRQPSIRRSAMIQSGTTAHQRQHSDGSAGSSNRSSYVPKPPFPVPTRSSSRRIPLSKSEGSQSPTLRSGGAFTSRRSQANHQHARKESLRKVRSAAVIPRTGRRRSRSPPVPQTPLAPQSPPLPPMPNDTVHAGQHLYSSQRLGHRSQPSSNNSYHTATGSVASSAQQASVVDAIAATMVGEWMWKYVRKRTTFGPPDSPHDLARSGDEGSAPGGNGVRHKRWVWLSPYERAVMWSSKQPTSGSALLGKSGRKLTIQSVLDVPDNTPLPRNAGVQPLFNRSILILTPARALKFTAVSRDRHYLWLTALSFLAHSTNGAPELASLPPMPSQEQDFRQRRGGATLGRAPIRDSVRRAKEKTIPNARSFGNREETIPEFYSELDGPLSDAASPPVVPRFASHGRKRSLTGPRVPPVPSFRSFSNNAVPSSAISNASSDPYNMPPSVPSSVYNPASVRTSEASSSARRNFFDAVGTVRMEAFIEPTLSEDAAFGLPGVGGGGGGSSKPRPGRRRGNSQWSGSSTNDSQHRAGGLYDDFRYEASDPFKGF